MFGFNFEKRGVVGKDSNRVYLDYAAATPLRKEVIETVTEAFSLYGNASAIHKEGVAARSALEEARLQLARSLKVRPEGVVFTGNGTESNNLAITGLLDEFHKEGRDYTDMTIISTNLEHPSVTEVLHKLQIKGVRVEYCTVDDDGLIDLNHFRSLLSDQVVLVTMAYVNSEIGVVQPISKVARLVKKYNQENSTDIKVHTDGAQAPLWLPCQFDALGVDLLSLDAGKCYGPKGIGVLVLRHGVKLGPVLYGGGQEMELRPGTENTPLILGAVKSLLIAQDGYKDRSEKVANKRDELITSLSKIDGVVINGSLKQRVANNVNISVSGVDGEFAVISLDEKGYAVSTKSACSGSDGGGSKVVETIYDDSERAKSTIRITLGEETTTAELASFSKELVKHIEKTREAKAKLTQA